MISYILFFKLHINYSVQHEYSGVRCDETMM